MPDLRDRAAMILLGTTGGGDAAPMKRLDAATPSRRSSDRRGSVRWNTLVVAAAVTVPLAASVAMVMSIRFAAEAGRVRHNADERLKRAHERADAAFAAREEADQQARVAKAVTEFLAEDLLGSIDAWRTTSRDIAVLEVLDEAARRADGRFTREPAVRSAVLRAIGNAYRRLGAHDSAEMHLKEALQLRRTHLGENHEATLLSMGDMARLRAARGQWTDAEALFEDALARMTKRFSAVDERTLALHVDFGAMYAGQQRYDDAEPIVRQALGRSVSLLRESHPVTIEAKRLLGRIMLETGRNAEAAELYRQALETCVATRGEEDIRTVGVMTALAEVAERQGRIEESIALRQRVVEINRRLLGDGHRETIMALEQLGGSYMSLGRYDEAERCLAKSVAAATRSLPAGDSLTGVLFGRHAECLRRLQRYERAEAAALRAHEILKGTSASPDRRLGDVVRLLVEIYEESGRADTAATWRAKLSGDPLRDS